MTRFVLVLPAVCMLLCGCRTGRFTHADCGKRVEAIGGAALSRAGQLTMRDHMRASTDGSYAVDIPSGRWHEPIRRLRPLRVYHDQLNVVIVLYETADSEAGLYVCNPISSFISDWHDSADMQTLYDPDRDDPNALLGVVQSYKRKK
ncbi:hypothetical protein ACFLSJ_02840 [Verrucomicrobiota bacterium]